MADQDPRAIVPQAVRAPMGGDTVEIEWADGHRGILPNALLRGYCPCASCQGHSGQIRFVPGHNAVIDQIEEVGSYALQFTWGDGHNSGIFTFRYLRRLCACPTCLPGSPVEARTEIPRSAT